MAYGKDFAEKNQIDEEKLFNETKKEEVNNGSKDFENPDEVDVFVNKNVAMDENAIKRRMFQRQPRVKTNEPTNTATEGNSVVHNETSENQKPEERVRFKRPQKQTNESPQNNSSVSNKGSFQPKGVISSNEETMSNNVPIKITGNGLDARLERLIDIVADYLKKSPEEIKDIKKNALKEPALFFSEYNQIYQNEIQPLRQGRYSSIEMAKKEMPDKIVFMFVRDGNSILRSMNRSEAGAKVIYDGVVIESVQYTRTPFGPSTELFAPEINAPEVLNTEKIENKESAPSTHKRKM